VPKRRRRLRARWTAVSLATAVTAGLLLLGGGGPAGGALSTGPDAAGVTWLCRPGQPGDPCRFTESAATITAAGTTSVVPASGAANPSFDCFYAYPTVEPGPPDNAPAAVTPFEEGAAVAEASRFSQVCNVWAPTYRQRTSVSLNKGLGSDRKADLISYDSFLAGWKDYLANDNDGRPVIFIGHSQGAANLIRLLRGEIDDNPALRSRMVLAIILGGNVQVPDGRTVGGSFKHIPECTSTHETSCVIAYSSFAATPPRDALFGRPGAGVSLQSGQTQKSGVHVVCTNPADLGSASAAPLTPYFFATKRQAAETGVSWVTYPGLYTAKCMSKAGANWLQISSAPGDPRPVVKAALGPTWGLHEYDVNLALGDLIEDVARAEAAYSAKHPEQAAGLNTTAPSSPGAG
jgi:hypothetical protein